MSWKVIILDFLRDLACFDEASNDVSFNDDEYIKDLDRQTMIILWGQIRLCFYRFRLNDLLYNGHKLSSPDVLTLCRAMDKLIFSETNALAQYAESQRVINSGGQL